MTFQYEIPCTQPYLLEGPGQHLPTVLFSITFNYLPCFDNSYEFEEHNQDNTEAYENQDPFVEVQIKEESVEKKDVNCIETPKKKRSFPKQNPLVEEQMLCQICPILELTTSARKLRAHRKPNHKKGNKYYCPHCDHLENKWSTLLRHVSTNHQEHYEENFFSNVKPLKRPKQKSIVKEVVVCEICPILELTNSNLILGQHRMKYHGDGKQYKCPHCEKKTNVWINLLSHVHYHHNEHYEKKFFCEICQESFIFSNMLGRHKKTAHIETGKKTNMCESCGIEYQTLIGFQVHMAKYHNTEQEPVLMCDKCDYTAPHKTMLQKHVRLKHDIDRHKKCPCCDFTALDKQKLHIHIDIHHPEYDEKKLFCDKCAKSFIYESSLKHHVNFKCKFSDYVTNVTKPKLKNQRKTNVKCDHCSEILNNKKLIKTHYKEVHPDMPITLDGIDKFPCSHCNDFFFGKYHLERHTYLKHGIETRKKYCQKCYKPYTKQHTCQGHFGKVSSYSCDHCHLTFTSKENMKVHVLRVHEKRLDFDCEYCGKKWPTLSTLKNHVRQAHTQHVICEICKKKISNPLELRRHKVFVHKQTEGAWLCPKCPKVASFSKSTFEKHMRTKH